MIRNLVPPALSPKRIIIPVGVLFVSLDEVNIGLLAEEHDIATLADHMVALAEDASIRSSIWTWLIKKKI